MGPKGVESALVIEGGPDSLRKALKNMVKRSVFIVNRPFQFKYSLLLALVGVLIAILFSAHIFYFLNQYLQVVIPNYIDHPQIYDFIMSEKRKIIIYLIVLITLLACFLFFMGVVITHKIAGPMMVIKRKMAEVEKGDFEAHVRLRKGDEFRDFADSFNKMLNSLADLFKKRQR